MSAPDLPVSRFRVLSDWVDYNGHMGDFAYGIAFSRSATAMMEDIGLDEAYRTAARATLYTLEMRIGYQRECHEGDALMVETRVQAADPKRMHLYQEMRSGDGTLLAWCEQVLLHVARDTGTPRAAPFPPATAERLAGLSAQFRPIGRPGWLERPTGLG
ncbi:4-hydroxybenzoyl-CoA thioesterase [Salipiger pallidus]|uniref:4-hydroxybenzoyl-CoA thioesterase n=1 Tax=Salipiger pallidus TaxID=1775170 RepID=A0A8J2ZNH4_9RHOB|nr:thioesterase family protein [Salipiger pallidus]GGG83777.1 4-hydroxybenzoyl-CoA thioesterase [Salipiger pallidus]